MDPGGYVNEGGQLKSSNGQKYIINNPPRGRYCSNCAIAAIVGLIFILLATAIGLLVLVLHPDSLCTGPSTSVNGAVQHASTFGFTRAPANPKLNTALRTLELEEGSVDGARNEDYIDDAAETQPDPFPAEAEGDTKDPAVPLSRADFWLPRAYSLIIEPNITSATNNGTVTIEIERNRRSKRYRGPAGDLPPVVLDIEDIFILSTSVLDTNTGEQLEYDTHYGPHNASFVFELSGGQKAGLHNVTLVLSFVSKLSDTNQLRPSGASLSG